MLKSVDDEDLEAEEVSESLDKVYILTRKEQVVKDHSTDTFLKLFSKDTLPKNVHQKITKGFQDRYGRAKSKQYVEGADMYGATDTVEPPYNQAYLAKLYEKNSVHAASVDAKIDNIVGLGYYWDYTRRADKLRARAAKKGKEKKSAVESKLIDDKLAMDDMLDDMNSLEDFEETIRKVITDRFTTGNGYLEIGRALDGRIVYIGHIPSEHMRVRRKRDGFVQYAGERPIFFRNFGDRKTPDPFGNDPQPNEIIHYKRYTPTNNYYGVPEVVAAVDNIAGIEFANKYNIEYFQNKAVPRYIIKVKGMNIGKRVYADLLRFLETSKGEYHRSMVIPLPNLNADVQFEPLENKRQEASFVEYIKQNTEQILARHRVPANRLGMNSGGGLGDSRDSNKIFKESVCGPEQKQLEKRLSRVFRELTDLFVFKLRAYTLTDENEQSQIDERDVRSGIRVPDEIREDRGWGPRPDGNGDEPIDAKSMADAALEAQERQAKLKPTDAGSVDGKVEIGGEAGKAVSQQKATAGKTRTRDADRSSAKTDGTGATRSRNPKGSGRQQQ